MRMYIANGTHQNVDFQYRIPEARSYRQQNIPIGGQVRISGELSSPEIELIIQFHEKYNIKNVSDFHNHSSTFIPYIYSVDEPIPASKIAELVEQNRKVLEENGRKQRIEAALATTANIEENSGQIKNLEMTVEEIAPKDRDAVFPTEAIRITRDRDKGAPQDPKAQRALF